MICWHGDSYFWSEYHKWFVELGYADLDINRYEDGEWEIIQVDNNPIIPSETKWRRVLSGIRGVIPTRGIIEKFVKSLDPWGKEFWDKEEAKTKKLDEQHAAAERHRLDIAEKATEAITHNPDLVERIARNGLQEMNLESISKHIPNYKFR